MEGKELISDVTYEIDVWDNGVNRQKCEEIARKVNETLTANRFKRVLGRGFRDPSGLHRKLMYYKTFILN